MVNFNEIFLNNPEVLQLGYGLSLEELKKANAFRDSLKFNQPRSLDVVIESLGLAFKDFLRIYKGRNENPFFMTTFLIGGNLTKGGERKDIDLLTATNIWYPSGIPYSDSNYAFGDIEVVTARINGIGTYFKIKTVEELPPDYAEGITNGKMIFKLQSRSNLMGGDIDLVYVRNFRDPRASHQTYGFNSEEEFVERDIDKNGKQLQRMPLHRLESDLF